VKFVMDASASRFKVQAIAMGLLSSFGHNPNIGIRGYQGEIECAPDTYENASVRLTVKTSAMEVLDEMKSDDRKKLEQEMYGSVLESERFPTATFESKAIKIDKMSNEMLVAHVNGNLTFHGVTNALSLDARVTVMGTMLRISGEFPLRQSDYSIKAFSFAGGALKLKDEVKFSFEMVARKQD